MMSVRSPTLGFPPLLLLLVLLASECHGRSGGAPNDACISMTPGHEGAAPQETPFPYGLNVSSASVQAGGNVMLTISASGGQQFRGFLVQARRAMPSDPPPLGQFVAVDGTTSQIIECCGLLASAVTHINPNPETSVTVTWQAPADLDMDVVFVATVVQDFTTFWVGGRSDIVTMT